MKATKIPTDSIFSDKEMKCLRTCNERQRHQYLASKADSLGCHGVSMVCEVVGFCRDTLYRGRHELDTDANDSFPKGRVRAVGGGRTSILKKHPEYLDVFDEIVASHTEHCMFGPISRSWSGAPLLSVEDARTRAEATVTKKGLSIIAKINQRTYETKRPIEESYESNKSKRIFFDDELPKWNYLIKCCS